MSFETDSFLFAIILSFSVFIFFAYLFYKLHIHSPVHTMAINLWYAFIFSVMSVVFLDYSSVYVSELDQVSQNNNTLPLFLFLNLLIFLGFVLGLRLFKVASTNLKVERRIEALMTLSFLTILVFVYAINFFLSDSLPGLSDDVRRYDYWVSSAKFTFLPAIFGVIVFFFPVVVTTLIIYYKKINANKFAYFLSCLYLFLYFIYLFLTGQKFNGFMLPLLIIYATFVCMNQFLNLGFSLKKIRKQSFYLVIFFLTLGIADLISRDYAQQMTAFGATIYRVLVLQGSTYWGLYNNYIINGISDGNLYEILTSGSNLIKFEVMPYGSAQDFIDNGINLSGNITGYFLIFFGIYGAVLLSLFYGLLFAFTSVTLLNTILKFRLPEVIIVSMLWLSVMACYSRGSLESIFSLKTIFLILSFYIFKLIRRV